MNYLHYLDPWENGFLQSGIEHPQNLVHGTSFSLHAHDALTHFEH